MGGPVMDSVRAGQVGDLVGRGVQGERSGEDGVAGLGLRLVEGLDHVIDRRPSPTPLVAKTAEEWPEHDEGQVTVIGDPLPVAERPPRAGRSGVAHDGAAAGVGRSGEGPRSTPAALAR
jgi:hypothetical protein